MATSLSKPEFDLATRSEAGTSASQPSSSLPEPPVGGQDALQALLAFSSLHEQIRQRRAREAFGGRTNWTEGPDQFVLYEVLQLVAERALALTGADGVAIALVQEGEIVCRAATGPIAPDIGARLDPKAGISGACFRTANTVRCDDAENDPRVDAVASRKLNSRSMIAVPLCGRRSVIGLLEAFSTEAYGFNESDVKSLGLLAELILGAIKPDEEELLESLSPVPLHGIGIHGALSREKLTPVAPEPAVTDASTGMAVEPIQPAAKPSEPATPPAMKSITVEHPDLGTLELQDVKISELFAQPVPEPEPTPVAVADVAPVADEPEVDPQIFSEYQEPKKSRPGLALVLSFVGVAAVAAGLLWWRLHAKTTADAAVDNAPAVAASSQPKLEAANAAVQEPAPTQDSSEAVPANPVPSEDAARNVLPVVSGIRHWESDGSTTVVIDLQDQVQYEVHRLTSPERIYFDLHDTVLGPAISGGKPIEVGNSQLVRIRIAQPVPGVTRIVLETRDVSNFSVSLESNPYRLIAEIRSSGGSVEKAPSNGTDVFKPQAQAEHKLTSSIAPSTGSAVPRTKIVVDAGHGGWDLGTIGRKGLVEKDLVLDIAQRLGKLLESKLGAEVVYTRADDNYIPLEKRAEMANASQADVFVSVHANYSDLPSARGVETYYTNFSSSGESLDVEKRENATAKTAPGAPTLTGVALKERTAESRRLAASVERALYSTLASATPGIRDRGVKEAGFVVLTGTSMPAILAEVSFVSSPTDEKNLQSSEYRQQIADALYKGIAKYEASSNHVKLASASGKPTGR